MRKFATKPGQSDREDQLKATLEHVANLIATEVNDETFDRYTKMMMTHFRRYSWMNSILIMMANPEATAVNSLKRWNEVGWKVKSGEHGIVICVPKQLKREREKADGTTEVYYQMVFRMVGHVFDISQCEHDPSFKGERYDPNQSFIVDLKQDTTPILKAVMTLAEDEGYTVNIKNVGKMGALGYASSTGEIALAEGQSPSQMTQVMIHEYAHQALDHTKTRGTSMSKSLKEGEVQSVVVLVMSACGFDVGKNSAAYIRNHKCEPNDILKSVARIVECAKHILDAIEAQIN